jgi:ornithine carbamoyltransferase
MLEFTPEDLDSVLDLAARLKRGRNTGLGEDTLVGKTTALIFEKPSTRTRVSFQVAMSELGGDSLNLSSSELQLCRGETVEDTAGVLSRYVHCIMARVNRHSELVRLAATSSVPVINGLSDLHHPVQILADLLTLRERKGSLRRLRVAWVGDGDNVCNSWAVGAALSGIEFVVATPKGYEPSKEVITNARNISRSTRGSVELVSEQAIAVKNADCVITDTFMSMGLESERGRRLTAFVPGYQVNASVMTQAKKDALFLHCLPAHRGEEVTSEVLDGPQSAVFDEAENRLHTTKALLCFLLLDRNEHPLFRP